MGKAISMHLRELIVKDRESGKSLMQISQEQNLSYSTVRNLWKRYQQVGIKGLAPNYSNCGPKQVKTAYPIYRRVMWLKRRHPKWGAPYIRTLLQQRYPTMVLPSARTMQLWFRKKGYNHPKSTPAKPKLIPVETPHDCWQVDAKEKLILVDNTRACYLTIVDAKSGAIIDSPAFPPQTDKSS